MNAVPTPAGVIGKSTALFRMSEIPSSNGVLSAVSRSLSSRIASAMLSGRAVTAGSPTRNEIVPASSFDTANDVMSNPAPASPAGSARLLVPAAPRAGYPDDRRTPTGRHPAQPA